MAVKCGFILMALVFLHNIASAQNTCDSPGTLISLSTTGQNTSSGYITTYVLTNAFGNIIQTVVNPFNAPNTPGNYKVYTVNYDGNQTAPSFTTGINISAIGGSCVAVGSSPLSFTVCPPCDAPGTSISFTTSNQNTTSGYITRYFLTNSSNIILNEVTSPFNLPNIIGDYKVYTINYDSNQTLPTFTTGINITAIGGACTAIGTPMFFSVCPLNISGNVFDDVNGLTDAIVNGTGTNATSSLYANLLDNSNNVIATVAVANNGTYSFSGLNAGVYTVQISTNQGTVSNPAPTTTLPTNWVNTGENIGTSAGNDGTANGSLAITLTNTSITNANFGIEQTPNAGALTATSQVNPNGTTQATVPGTTFSGSDPDGTVASLTITAFPSNATSITINGVNYTSATFPLGGVNIPTNTSGEPTQTITVDPIDGAVNVVIPYTTTDNAGFASAGGTATVPFTAATYTLSGNVFDDANGLTDAIVNGTGTNATSSLYANLLDNSNNVIATVAVANNGTYSFSGLNAGVYTVQISTNQGTVSNPAPTTTLPTNWVNTGENIGTSAGNDGTANGSLAITLTNASITNANFGIEQTPNAGALTAASQVNPNGTTQATVPSTTFSGSDPDGTVASLTITAFPSNATSITINSVNYTSATFPVGGVNIPTNTSGEPTQTITVDPIDGAVNVVIPYTTTDNAGFASAGGTATVPFTATTYTLSGTIFTDLDGLTDGAIDGTATNIGGTLYANLLDGGVVVQSILVANDGTYIFTNVLANTSYTVVLTTSAASVNAALPVGYTNIGEGLATNGDGTIDGQTTISVTTSSISGINFGIKPTCELPGTSVSFTTTGNTTTAGFVTVSLLTNAGGAIIQQVSSPFNLPNNGGDYMVYTINYDAMGTIPTLATGTNIAAIGGSCTAVGSPMFFTVCPVSIAGSVLHDSNGLTDAVVNGTGTNISGALYANLISGGAIVQSVLVANDGTYLFPNVTANTSYNIIIATSSTTTTPILPTNWVNTGENIGTSAGNDGTANGSLAITLTNTSITNANFGIEQTPNAGALTAASQVNPNGTTQATVPGTTFSGSDPDGTVASLTITAFPSNATSITINGANYTSATFPVGGVNIPTNTSGEPTQTITVDPIDGAVNVVIPYTTTDNAGFASAGGTATVPFTVATLCSIGNYVWNDLDRNGIQDNGEVGLAGIEVVLYDNLTGNSVAALKTDAYGHYLFSELPAGDYRIGYTLPLGYQFSPQGTGTDSGTSTDSDVNPNTGLSRTITLTTGENELNVSAGMYIVPTNPLGTVTGYTWFDGSFNTSNSVQDNSEKGLSGITVTLYDGAGLPIATTVTDANGEYTFNNIPTGTYSVGFTQPVNMIFTGQHTGTDDGSDANPTTSRTPSFSVGAGQTIASLDAGFKQPDNSATNRASIGAIVWNDMNNDGLENPDEIGVAGVTVTLYGTDGTTVIKTTVTDAFGHYIFNDLPEGGYRLGFSTLPSGFSFVTKDANSDANDDMDSDVAPASGLTPIYSLAAGQADMTAAAGLYNPSLPTASIGNYLWNDANKDGVQDATESGFAGVAVNLYDATGTTLIAKTTTDINGHYLFPNLPAGNYAIQFSNLPQGYTFTTTDAIINGSNDSNDSDADKLGWTAPISLATNEQKRDVSCGIYPQGTNVGTASIGNFVWFDTNNDGIQNDSPTLGSDGLGVQGVTVYLYNANNTTTPIASTTTDATGHYLFTGLAAGEYVIGSANTSLPNGYNFSPQNTSSNGATDANDSDISGTTGLSDAILLAAGESNTSVGLGIYNATAPSGTIGNIVWYDADGNGGQDAGEPGIAGITINLINDVTGEVVRTTTTDNLGRYLFVDVPFGTYHIAFQNIPTGFSFTTANDNTGGTTDATDSDAIPTASGLSGMSSSIILNSTTPTNFSVAAGLITTTRAAIGNYVWFDENGNGIQDIGEKGLPGITVSLYDATGTNRIASVVTDAEGYYIFNNLIADSYILGFDKLPDGTSITTKNAASGNATNDSDLNTTGFTDVITLFAGDYNMDIDAGITIHKAAINGTVWYDTNTAAADGMHDGAERGVAGVIVELREAGTNAIIATTVTNSTGLYSFSNLNPGNYYITFDKSTLPADYIFVAPDQTSDNIDSDANILTGATPVFTLTAGETNTTIAAGIDTKATIGDFVWNDANANGLQDIGELGIGGVTVNLYSNTDPNTIIATTVTKADGSYLLTNLNPDTYFIEFVAPSGFSYTTTTAGTDDGSDASSTNGQTSPSILLRAMRLRTLDAGFAPITLPVKLLYFRQTTNACEINLSWATATEQNSRSFEVWRSDDGKTWHLLTTIAAAGTSNTMRSYSFVDNKPNRENYYRLVQIDIDGHKATYNLGQKVQTNGCFEETANGISGLFPNPNATDKVTVKFYTDRNDSELAFELYDIAGKLVDIQRKSIIRGANIITLDISLLAQGTYLIRTVGDGWYSLPERLIKVQE